MDTKDPPHDNETDTDDSEFEDALEELIIASGIETDTPAKSNTPSKVQESSPNSNANRDNESNSHLIEERIAKEIVEEAIESAKQILTCDSTADSATAVTGETPTLYQDIPADDTDDNAVQEVEEETVEKFQSKVTDDENKESENNENAKQKDNDEKESDNKEDDKDEEEESDEEKEDERFVVDEELLKEREANLTDEEKQELKEQAQVLKSEGNDLFKANNFVAAVVSYTNALRTCPLSCAKERSIMYSNRAACKLHMDQKESATEDCTKALELNPNYMKCLLRRAELYEKTDKLDEALGDYQKALEMDPGLHIAREACMRLPDQIKERNEKLKEEMMGKLKDLGNLVLRPFGLSTDNFKLNQDPNTGGYSVAFQQNPGKS